MYNVMNLGLDFDDPNFVEINNKFVKPYENKLKQLYTEQNKLYKQAIKLKSIPKKLQKQIEFNNKKISTVVDLAGGRVQGLQLDEVTLKPKTYGKNYANVLGFGIYDKPVKELTDIDRAEIAVIMQGQIENEKKSAQKTAAKLFQNKEYLKDVDTLAIKSMVPGMTTADKIERPKSAKLRDSFKKFGKYAKQIAKPVVRVAAPFVPFVGPIGVGMGVSDTAKAAEQGYTSPDELALAYLAGPEAAKGLDSLKEKVRGQVDETEEFVP